MKKLEEFLCREIMDEYIMMPVGSTASKFKGMIMANPVSSFIWEHIEEVDSVEELSHMIVENFEVEYDEAYQDCLELVENMKKAKWIE